ncbi:MAG TPA: hypothetical protein DIT04_01125 [Dysgonomonas sp.]|nr:hypothetical protein [Dysgonomonas sp.]
MSQELNSNIFSKKDARITIGSIVVVILIFLSQLFLMYRWYQSNIDLLHRELNLAVDEIQKEDLNRRLQKSVLPTPIIQYYGKDKPSEVTDTTNVLVIDSKGAMDSIGSVITMNGAMEDFAAQTYPINLIELDSVAKKILERRGITNSFYSEIIDKEANVILDTTIPSNIDKGDVLSSSEIPVNAPLTKVLRINLINPMSSFYKEMILMLVLSLLLCVALIYSFYVHQRTLARQKEVAKLKDELYSSVSHEFKRPLHALVLVISMLGNPKILQDEAKRIRYTKLGEREIDKMKGQVEMILTMAKDEEGFFNLVYTDFDVVNFVRTTIDMFLAIQEKPGELEIEFTEEMQGNYMMNADADHMTLVICNLIENAIKYSEVPKKVKINLSRYNKSIRFSVKDNGLGISQEDQSRIFDRYVRVNENATNAKGHGIGLHYVKRIVEKHKGTVSVNSVPGEGSEFVVVIPQ